MGEKEIYIVVEEVSYEYEGGHTYIVGVFTDKEEAERIVKERNLNPPKFAEDWDYYKADMLTRVLNREYYTED